MSSADNILHIPAESPKNTMPTSSVRTAPIPVQTL